MSVETKWYLIEYTTPGSIMYLTENVMAEDPYEAIDMIKRDIVGVEIQNVFLQLNGKWNRDE